MPATVSPSAGRDSRRGFRLPLLAAVIACLGLAGVFAAMLVRHRAQPLALHCLAATAAPVGTSHGLFGHARDDGRMIVTSLDDSGPAARAGIRVGDILPAVVAIEMAAGGAIPDRFAVVRDAATITVTVDLPRRCRDQSRQR